MCCSVTPGARNQEVHKQPADQDDGRSTEADGKAPAAHHFMTRCERPLKLVGRRVERPQKTNNDAGRFGEDGEARPQQAALSHARFGGAHRVAATAVLTASGCKTSAFRSAPLGTHARAM